MIPMRNLRALREARISESMQHGTDLTGYRRGAMAFVRELHESLGVAVTDQGRAIIPLDARGLPVRPKNVMRPEEYSLRGLAEAIMGHEFVEDYFHPAGGNGFDFSNRHLLEAAIDPTAFVDISTFNLGVAGLVNAKIMERFNAPDYIGVELVEIVPTNQNGHKRIGIANQSGTTKASKGRQPGEQHQEVGYGEMYQTTPITVEQAEKVMVTKEAVFFDLTGDVLRGGEAIGDDLKYGQERDIAASVLGVTNLASKYNFNGTSYETYQSSSPWVNTQANGIVAGSFDITNIDKARQLFFGMTDPVTAREIRVVGKAILVNPYQELLLRAQLYTAQISIGSQNTSAGFPSWWQQAGNDLAQLGANMGQTGPFTVIPMTSIWYNMLTASATAANGYNGLAQSAANAKQYWYIGDFPRAFEWQENWPLTPWQAAADEFIMKDRGLLAAYGANYRGSMFVKEPRYVVQNTN
ncbi:MAG: hypothetical protein ACRESF_01905 [Pseudomonas sp.]